AISLFEADVATTSASAIGTYTVAYANSGISGANATSVLIGIATSGPYGFVAADVLSVASNTSRLVSGSGWIPVNLNAISSGAPIGSLPVDPTNNQTNF